MEQRLRLRKMKKGLYLQEHRIKASFLYVIGQPVQPTRPGVKTILLLGFGTNKGVSGLLLPSILCRQMMISS
mgnify:CR=1 FL=1